MYEPVAAVGVLRAHVIIDVTESTATGVIQWNRSQGVGRMTAEVAVMNSIGVALAADSAVSIGTDARKIFTSSDKLFQLSRVAPIGVMTYGNMRIAEVPWETVIKAYRSQCAANTFPTLERYAENFISFLSHNRGVLTERDREEVALGLVRRLFLQLCEEIRRALDSAAERADGLGREEISRVIAECVRCKQRLVANAPRLLSASEARGLTRAYSTSVRRLKGEIFGALPMSAATSRAIVSLSFEMLSRRFFGPLKTGLVFAGFGEEEFRPRVLSFEVEGMVRGRLRCARSGEYVIGSDGTRASIVPFAQQEMIHSFMKGIDQSIERFLQKSTRIVIEKLLESIVQTLAKEHPRLSARLGRAIEPASRKLLSDLFEQWQTQCERYWFPVVQIVSTLPKDELASMAEALVNLTKFRRRVTPAKETVGGPIDVAVITKGDGFVWIKRKHYFDPKLNPRVVSRLQRETLA